MRHTNKLLIILSFLFITILTSCNFDIISKKKGQVFFDFSDISNQLKPNSRSVLDSIIDPETEYFIDLKIDGSYKLNTTIDLSQQTYYEITDIPAGTRIKASIEVYSWNMNLFPHTKNILFTGESKSCVISSGENQIEIKLKANFKITFKIYVRYNADYQNSNWENEPEENDGLTKDTGFYYIQSAINWIAANGNNKKDYEIVLTGYDQTHHFGQGFEFGDNLTYYTARSITLSSSNKDLCALIFNSKKYITVKTWVPVIFNNIIIQANASTNQILETNSNTNVTLGKGTSFIGWGSSDNLGSAIGMGGGSVTMEEDAKISRFNNTNGGAVWISSGYFYMTGKSSISDCHAFSGNGGAVCMNAQTSSGFSMTDNASITNCSAQYYGGAIYSKYHSVSISGGSITDCTAQYYGGAIYMDKDSSSITLNISGGEIKNNYATKGSAIYLAKDNQLEQMKAQLILSENACIDLSNDIYSEGQPIYLSGTLKIDKDKAARITYDSISGGKTILTLSERPSDTNAVTNSYSKFYVSDSNSTTHYYVSEQGQSVLFNNFITGDIQLGDIVFADNKRIRPADYNKIDYELYSSIAGIVFYSGTTDDLIGATNLIVGTKTYRNQFETSRHANSGYTIFHTMDITNFPDNENRWGGVDYTSCVSIEEAVFTCGKNSGNLVLNNTNDSYRVPTIDTIHDIFVSINNNSSSYFPLYQQVLKHGQLFANSNKYKLNIDNIDNPEDDDIITDNWYIPTIPELILFSIALKDSTFLNIYTKICGTPMESDYISQTALFTISSMYPDHYSNSSNNCFAYHFTINFSQNLIKCDSTDGYLYTIPVHVYEVN